MRATQTMQAVPTTQAASDPLDQFKDIRKAFGGVHAVDGVSLNLYPGEVVAVLGHNGAGKSTLMKMLAGAFPIDSGEIHADRRQHSPRQQQRPAL